MVYDHNEYEHSWERAHREIASQDKKNILIGLLIGGIFAGSVIWVAYFIAGLIVGN